MTRYERMTKAQLIHELAAQRASLERLHAVVAGSRDAVFISDEHSRFVLVNPAACELTGYSEKELLVMRIPDLHEEADRRAYAAHHGPILDGQEALTEADILRKDRTKVAAEFNSRRVVIANTRYMHTVARDITERKRAKDALRRSESRFRGMFEHITSGVAVYEAVDEGEDFVFLDFNPAGEKIEGVRREDLLGKRVTEAFPGLVHMGLLDVLRRAWRTGISEQHRASIYRDDRVGGGRDNLVYRLPGGEVVAVFEDTTERELAVQALLESEERYRALFDQANDIILVVELVPDGLPIIRDVNQAALRALGYRRDELIGNPISLVVAGDSPEETARRTAAQLRGTEATFEGEHRRKDGSVFLVEAAVYELTVGGRLLGISIERDITERKRMEDELRDSRDQLHSLTARLDDIREEERARLARELHDEVGQNLTAMRMDLAMVRAGLPAGEKHLAGRLHSMIELAQESVDRVNRMSSELRSPILDMLGLQAAVEAEVAEYQERWGTEIVLAPGVDTLQALPERDLVIFRVLKETLANVRQHAQANRVDVSLRMAGEVLVLEVLDDGIGITDEQAQSQESFGLIGMRERAGRLGGTVDVERRTGRGTRVRVKVPV